MYVSHVFWLYAAELNCFVRAKLQAALAVVALFAHHFGLCTYFCLRHYKSVCGANFGADTATAAVFQEFIARGKNFGAPSCYARHKKRKRPEQNALICFSQSYIFGNFGSYPSLPLYFKIRSLYRPVAEKVGKIFHAQYAAAVMDFLAALFKASYCLGK